MKEQKTCQSCKQRFVVTEEDHAYYSEMKVASPTLCPECRQLRRLSWRNERTLYHRTCDGTGKPIISVFSSDKPFPVYSNEYWHSSAWNALDYGREFDFNRPFFEQFIDLMNCVPQLALSATANHNSNFVNQCGWCKNCYLTFEADGDEDCMYSTYIYDSRSSLDLCQAVNCEICYECIDCYNCYHLIFSQDCENCSESTFLKNCIGCSNCYGCVNLRNKQYYFFNEKLSKEEYLTRVAEITPQQATEFYKLREQFSAFAAQFPHKGTHGISNEHSSGDYIRNTQNCSWCFDANHLQDCKFVYNARNAKKVYDLTVFWCCSRR